MSSVNYDSITGGSNATPLGPCNKTRVLHRIRTVRLQQGISLRTVARHSGVEMRVLRMQEEETCDMRLSDLQRWQQALDVPVADLLVDSEATLSAPVMQRARLIRLMKTAAAIQEHAPSSPIRRMAETLIGQLVEIMPELAGVSAWHTYGQRRSLDECGRIVDRCLSDDTFVHSDDD